MANDDIKRIHERWAHLRFSVVGPLFAAPPGKGELAAALQDLADREWRHPVTGEPVRFGFSTLERWYHMAKAGIVDPVAALRRKIRDDAGKTRVLNDRLRQKLLEQYGKYDDWSYLLHAQNLAVLVEQDPGLGPMPSYSTVLRFMKSHGLFRQPRRRVDERPGQIEARIRRQHWETRSYEAPHTNQLWHLDFHVGSRKVLLPDGTWVVPQLLGILDDHSRLACHVQWYLHENTQNLVHGLLQAFQKRDFPAGLMSDNGAAMKGSEFKRGLEEIGTEYFPTLDYSPHQNGKQESFWGQVEGRLLPMLSRKKRLMFGDLNEATQAWVELEYNQSVHSEIGVAPIKRYLDDTNVGRPCFPTEKLRRAFMREVVRTHRRSDGTIPLHRFRFEIPNAYRHFEKLTLLYARWDLSQVFLTAPTTGDVLTPIFPIDKERNADARRRAIVPPEPAVASRASEEPDEIAPLLQQLMERYSASGLPPAYLPKDENEAKKGRR